MGRRTIEESHIRNLQKTAGGSTYIVSLPIDVIRELKWKVRQMELQQKSGQIDKPLSCHFMS